MINAQGTDEMMMKDDPQLIIPEKHLPKYYYETAKAYGEIPGINGKVKFI